MSWNDSDSLRLLAKVLASVDGLERDALIASSAQFSILDSKTEADEETKKTQSVDQADKVKPTTATFKEEHSPTEDAKTVEENDTPQETNTTEEIEAAANDEELSGFYIYCNGNCDTEIKSWTEPFYLCLICTNTDLCVKCHSKRLNWNRDGGENQWTTFCGENHRYIKAPVARWKGIKSGVIRIGEEDIPVKQWIKGLKEERWPKAWETFWLRESGLKDIDE